MMGILRSPRRRRRVAYVAVALAAAAAVAVAVQALPGPKPRPPERWSDRQAVVASAEDRSVRLTRADRADINASIDAFINAAVKRRNPVAAMPFATPNLRSQATSAAWRKGDIPIYPYPARGNRFHGWTLNFSHRNHVNVDLLVMPQRKHSRKLGPVAFTVDLRKIRDRWLVDAVFPTAVFAPIPPQGNRGPVVSTYDLVPAAAGSSPSGARSRLSYAWFFLPVVVIGGGIALLLAYLLAGSLRARRERRRYERERSERERSSLPPLPISRSE